VISACIFDLDGVIVDTAKYHYLAWRRLASELGVHFTEVENERLKGVSRMRSLEIILELGRIHVDESTKQEWAEKKNGWFVEFILAMQPEEIFPGVKSLLNNMRETGYKVALASSSKNAPTVIQRLGIAREFDVIVDGTMIKNSKPDPEIFLLAAEKLGEAPSRCVVFEDAEAGVSAALMAGMKCVGIGSVDQLGKADIVIPHTGDFDLLTLTSW
jgi:beta-phosphoglucomutase